MINIDSFAKDENIINKPNDKLTGKKPVEFIQATHPIVIVDEPQNMETDLRKKAIENLNPLCTLRYSATHINRYNMVYSLDPVKAYDLGLVKQIEVDSIVTENDFNEAFVSLESVNATKTRTSAKIKLDVNTKEGVKRKTVTAKVGDDLYELSGKREIYKSGYIINGIDVADGFIELSNGKTLNRGDALGGLTDEVMKVQIRKTVEEHFQKEKKLKSKGIKVLSLFLLTVLLITVNTTQTVNHRRASLQSGLKKLIGKFLERKLTRDYFSLRWMKYIMVTFRRTIKVNGKILQENQKLMMIHLS
ncbi:hypothetical protein MNV_220002 [Candidatus Methanoperedens nitroreducens]|uniref:Uncharacterized protein n=1 Tax=Candidatus Methanoperedens nitratireducens TaxID=1392998 RepID=A0A284VP65_9EURY|nr:hypothetical protein MNV_220002 [Candidatus Methanoperedens nitroreducens]